MRRVVRTAIVFGIGMAVGAACSRSQGPGEGPVPADTVASGTLVEAEPAAVRGFEVETSPPALRLETAEADPLVDSEPDVARSVDVDAIVRSYTRYYREELYEVGSDVRGQVDAALVAHARRRVAMDRGHVQVDAWDGLVRVLEPAARRDLTARIEGSNRSLAAELHGGDVPDPGH